MIHINRHTHKQNRKLSLNAAFKMLNNENTEETKIKEMLKLQLTGHKASIHYEYKKCISVIYAIQT